MQAKKRTYTFWKAVCWLLLLQMINISIDPPDLRITLPAKKAAKQAAASNTINSVYELVSEELFENPVSDEENEKDIVKTEKPVELFCYNSSSLLVPQLQPLLKHQPFYTEPLTSSFFASPFQPPKQA